MRHRWRGVVTAIEIHAPIEQVFDYASGQLAEVASGSRRVSGATDHSAAPGERIAEEAKLARRLDCARAAGPLSD